MPDDSTLCPKCGAGSMTHGCLLDQSGAFETISHWVPGVPRGAGKLAPTTPQIRRLPVLAYRCEKCGFLELYAKKLEPPK